MSSKIIFIHHSTGANLLREGNIRSLLHKMDPSISLWDHSYNLSKIFPKIIASISFLTGLSNEKGIMTGKDYHIVLSNNSPKEYAEIFSRDVADKTLQSILGYDIIAFKNCYPTTKITITEQLKLYKKYYETIRDAVSMYRNKKFILVTPPPLREEQTKKEYADNAKELVYWLNGKEFLPHKANLFVFDLFGYLVNDEGFLKKVYCRTFPWDSHPNERANKIVGPLFARYLVHVAHLP